VSDEGFREIQLNGKQLVFLFMAATVVSVVIFLCGVLVGRGVRATSASSDVPTADVGPDLGPPASMAAPENTTSAPAVSTLAGTPAATGAATAPAEELSYAERLLRDTPPEEKLKAAPATPPKPPPTSAAPVVPEPLDTKAPVASPPVPAPRPAAPAPAAQTPPAQTAAAASLAASDPSGPGFAVQVAISKDRREADTLAKELIAKGYPAFVMDPAKGAPAGIYRVRVGKYKNRKDAEEIAARLKTVEQFAPWIAR
jgi:cell division protein FtsN